MNIQQSKSSVNQQISKAGKLPTGTVTKNFFEVQDIDDDYQVSSPEKLMANKNKKQEENKQTIMNRSLRKKKNIKLQPMKNAKPNKIDIPDFNDINANQQQVQQQNPEKNKIENQKKQIKANTRLNFHLSSSQDEQIQVSAPKTSSSNNNKNNNIEKKNQKKVQRQHPFSQQQNNSNSVHANQSAQNQQDNSRPQNSQQRTGISPARTLQIKNCKCYILRRHKQWFSKLWPQFNLHLQSNNQFFISGKLTGNNAASTIVISQSMEDFAENGPSYLGKIKANFMGNIVNIYGPGYNPSDHKSKQLALRNLLATVQYQTNFFGSTRPRNFRVFLLKPDIQYYSLQGTIAGEDQISLNQLYLRPKNKDKILVMTNRKPQWNQKIKGFMLNFGGRVKKPSIKNFILQDQQSPQNARLVFGKLDDDQFRLDIGEPLSPFIGFGIALSTFGGKIGCQ